MLSAARLADPGSLAARMARLQWANLFAATASFGWLATARDGAEIASWLAVPTSGSTLRRRRWVLPYDPVSEALGDAPELAGSREELERLLRRREGLQMLFASATPGPAHTPRRPVEAFLRY